MAKATWHFADGVSHTTGASGDLLALVVAGHKVAARRKTSLIGWNFAFKAPTKAETQAAEAAELEALDALIAAAS